MSRTVTLRGHDAIVYAEARGMTLSKAADPTEDAREGLSVAEARQVAREDAGLVYLTLDWAAARPEIAALRDDAGTHGDSQCVEDCGDALAGDDDAAAACMAVICEALAQQ